MPFRQAMGLIGILVVLIGMALESTLVVWIAIGLLGASVLLRVLSALRNRRGTE